MRTIGYLVLIYFIGALIALPITPAGDPAAYIAAKILLGAFGWGAFALGRASSRARDGARDMSQPAR